MSSADPDPLAERPDRDVHGEAGATTAADGDVAGASSVPAEPAVRKVAGTDAAEGDDRPEAPHADGDPHRSADADGRDGDPEPDDGVREQEAVLRRVPRIEVFLGLGALLGLVAAFLLTYYPPYGSPQLSAKQFTDTQVFGFLALFCVPIGMGLVGLLGTFLGRGRGERVRLVKGPDAQPRGHEE